MTDFYELWHEENCVHPVGSLEIDIEADVFNFRLNEKYIGCFPWFIQYAKDAVLPMNEMVKMWVLGRAPESHNELIDSLIKKAGLAQYDAYGFFKYNKGHFITDKFYVVERERRA